MQVDDEQVAVTGRQLAVGKAWLQQEVAQVKIPVVGTVAV